MATVFATTSPLSALELEKALKWLKTFRSPGKQYLEAANKIRVTETALSLYSYTDHIEASYHLDYPSGIPNGLYDLLEVIPLLYGPKLSIEEEAGGIRVNHLPLPRIEGFDLPVWDLGEPISESRPMTEKMWKWLKAHTVNEIHRPSLAGIAMLENGWEACTGSALALTPGYIAPGAALAVIPPVPLGDGTITCYPRHFKWELGNKQVTGQLIDAQYPDLSGNTETAMRTEWDASTTLEYKTVADWVKMAVTLSKDAKIPGVNLTTGEVQTGNIPAHISPLVEADFSLAVNSTLISAFVKNLPIKGEITIDLSENKATRWRSGECKALILGLRELV